MKSRDILNFFFELGQLKRIKHEGWRLAGIQKPESVAEHSLRAAQIGYILAELEGYKSPEHIATMLVFHDIGECRIGDLHKVANRYVQKNEEKAVQDQLKPLEKAGKAILDIWRQTENRSTKAGNIAKDADYLEQAITAKEYMEQGYLATENWIKNVKKAVKTKSAKWLLKDIFKVNSTDWWNGLKKL